MGTGIKRKGLLPALVVAGMSLGTAWAIRGQFGHEHGAAWAGAIGTLATLLIAGRRDWLAKGFYATMAGGLGWGIGGMMSYGLLVGYGRADDIGNAAFGLAMLFVVGGLYGFIGGGLLGVALSDGPSRKVAWHQVLLEMVGGAIVFYFFITEQFGWLANPPRSELWTACLGMAAALAWHLRRNGMTAGLRTAVYAGLGGGFGFASGSFLMVLGQVSGIRFNFWNVMEYSLGFWGGVGLAYGVLTSAWEGPAEGPVKPHRQSFHLAMLVFIVPFVMWQQNFDVARILETYGRLVGEEGAASLLPFVRWLSIAVTLAAGAFWWHRHRSTPGNPDPAGMRRFLFAHWALYMLLSWVITGAIVSPYRIEQYLYLANFALVMWAVGRVGVESPRLGLEPRRYLALLAGIAGAIVLMAAIGSSTHDGFKNSKKRFETTPPTADSTSAN
jgi:hypothetical protein